MLNEIENYIWTLKINKKNINYLDIYVKLINKFYSQKNSSIYKIDFVFYDKFKIDPSNFEETKILCKERNGQTKFRKDLVDFYAKCIVSGDDHTICQACHILPYFETKLNVVENGLLLNYNIHHLYDSFLISFKFIDNFDESYDNYSIVLSDKLKKESFKNYVRYANNIVKINKKSREYIDKKYKEFCDN